MFATRTHHHFTAALLACFLLMPCVTGCTQLQLPAIDPTGECFFLPCPNTTTLTLPCTDKLQNGCGPFGCLPEPAFTDPAPPPPCLQGAGVPRTAPAPPPAKVVDECADGPKAVLFDKHCDLRKLLHLPDRGKRGRILLNHRKIIAPVGGEVVLLSGVCGTDGYLMTGEPLEWMLTPDSVGTFIDVGDDKQGALHRLVARNPVEKKTGSYAIGRTSTVASLITRGNLRRGDDVPVKKGETWLSISSPSEGISRVTVMAPESDCWDQRKATATIYWVDAHWQFPAPLNLRAGEQAQLTTHVTRKEGELPASGWKVRYQVMNPEVALFDNGQSQPQAVIEAVVNENGDATAILRPIAPVAGTAFIQTTVIRPAGLDEALPRMTLGAGQTMVTWSAPRLVVRTGAPPFVARDEEFAIGINVSNSGDLTAENVRVLTELPPGVELVSTSLIQADGSRVPAQHTLVGAQILWDIDNLPAQTQLDIELNVRAKASFQIPVQARGAENTFAEDTVNVTVVQRNLVVTITPADPNARAEVGQETTFNIEVRNNGDQPISGVQVHAQGDQGLLAFAADTGQWQQHVVKVLEEPLLPNKPWTIQATYQVREPGQRCVQVTATGGNAQRATETACVNAVNPPPANPMVSARIVTGSQSVQQGEEVLVKYFVYNNGTVPLTDVRVVATYDPALTALQFTQGYDSSQLGIFTVSWVLPSLQPGQELPVEGEFRVDGRPGVARLDVAVSSEQGANASADTTLQVLARTVAPPPATGQAPTPQPAQPPQQPTPQPPPIGAPPINGSTTPIPGPSTPPAQTPGAVGSGIGGLQVDIESRDNPVVVGDRISLDLVVTNNRNVPEDDVILNILLPAGTRLEAVQSTMFQGDPVENISADGIVRLQPISQLRAGEAIRYTVLITGNQPQLMTVRAEATSRQSPDGVGDETRLQVQAR
ncbi:hypothetical protein [Rosistilla oblonga]|uniref:hypothetical protein n=1 Tax=Rosistilla oblonga TaxID=2527990 RepID=UPI003A9849C7